MSIKRFFREELIKKVIATRIRVTVLAGSATIEPPIGPTISQFGISASEFCNRFNILSSLYLNSSCYITVFIKKVGNDFKLEFSGAKSSSLLKSVGFLKKSDLRFFLFLSDLFKISKFKFFEYNIKSKYNSIFRYTNSLFGTFMTLNATLLLD